MSPQSLHETTLKGSTICRIDISEDLQIGQRVVSRAEFFIVSNLVLANELTDVFYVSITQRD